MEENVFVLEVIGFSGHGHHDGGVVGLVRQLSGARAQGKETVQGEEREEREREKGSSYGEVEGRNALKSTIPSPAG